MLPLYMREAYSVFLWVYGFLHGFRVPQPCFSVDPASLTVVGVTNAVASVFTLQQYCIPRSSLTLWQPIWVLWLMKLQAFWES